MAKIDIAMFRTWQQDPVTLEVQRCLKKIELELEATLLNPDVLMGEQKRITHTLGMLEMATFLVNLTLDDLPEEKEDENSSGGT